MKQRTRKGIKCERNREEKKKVEWGLKVGRVQCTPKGKNNFKKGDSHRKLLPIFKSYVTVQFCA
jgi:hypothetical protein